ncbi:MAG: MFS transporter [Conexivisphaera sp.]
MEIGKDVKDTIYMVQRIDRLPMNRFMVYLALVSGMGLFFDIYDIDTMSASIAPIKSIFNLNPLMTTLTISMAFIGMFFGSLISGTLADRYGRRRLFVITLSIIAIGSFLTAISTNLYELWIFRFITGFGIGGDMPVVWAYLTEMTPTKYRGRLMGIAMILGVLSLPTVGLTATYFVSTFPVNGWRYVFLTGALIALAVLAVRYFAPESPRYYLIHNNPKAADEVLSSIEKHIERIIGKPLPPYDKSEQYSLGVYKAPLRELFSKDAIRSTLLASVVWIFQTWGFYGFTAFLPLILIAKGYTLVHAIMFTAIGWAGGFLGPVIVTLVGERFQRKYLLTIYAALSALFIGLMAATPPHSPALVITTAFIVNIFIQAWAATLYSYVPEIFPARIRATGSGFANALGRGFNVVGLLAIGVALAGSPAAQLGFTAVSWIICIVAILALGYRTSGMILEEITERRKKSE